jgi:hypothetical protein
MALGGVFWQLRRMAQRTPVAGGFFILLAILVGLGLGILKGEPMIGVVVGTALGVALAVAVWILDRGRRAP